MSVDNRPHRPRVLVTGESEGLADLLAALADHPGVELVGAFGDVRDAIPRLDEAGTDVVLHGTRYRTLPQTDLSTIREHTSAPIILLAPENAPALLESALDADVEDVLVRPPVEKVVFAVRKASASRGRAAPRTGRRGKVVTVFAPKGGIGKTVTATNLAAALARYEKTPTLLLDLDLQFGDAAIVLGMEPKTTVYDLVVAPGELDSEKLGGYTARHGSGLDVLPAPLRPEDAELVTEAKLAHVLDVAADSYGAVVVDTSPFFHGPNLTALDRTDVLLLLCAPEVPTVKNVRLGLETLELLKFPRDRIRLVLNRANSEVGIKPREVEDVLGVPVDFELPSERAVPVSVNQGNPLVLTHGDGAFGRGIRAIATATVPAAPARGVADGGGRRRWLPSLSRS